jgi:hypothetical protein
MGALLSQDYLETSSESEEGVVQAIRGALPPYSLKHMGAPEGSFIFRYVR